MFQGLLKFSFILACLISPMAAAQFYLPEEAPRLPQQADRALAATWNFKVGHVDGDCSAVAISNDGHFLTNMHCLADCLDQNIASGRIEAETFTGQNFSFTHIKNQNPTDAHCIADPGSSQFSITGPSISQDFYRDPQIVWLGRGRGSFSNGGLSEMNSDQFNTFLKNEDDFVVLKYRVKRPTTCVNLSQFPAIAKDDLWALGFPSYTTDRAPYDSDGYRRHFSLGQVQNGIWENEFRPLISPLPHLPPFAEPQPRFGQFYSQSSDRLQKLFHQSRFLYSDVDAVSGNSGGMILNENGEVVALLFGRLRSKDPRDAAPTTLGLHAHHMQQSLVQGLSPESFAAVLSCK